MNQFDHRSPLYEQFIHTTRLELSGVKNKIYRIGSLRILLFLAGIAGIIACYEQGAAVVTGICTVTFIPFLALVKYHNRLFYLKEYLEKKIEVNENELAALDYNMDSFDGGEEFIDSGHFYTYDLDVFGNNSLFQYINRTTTFFGKMQLADRFLHHLTSKQAIEEQQQAVSELTPEVVVRQHFQILGSLYKGKASDGQEINLWAESKNRFKGKKLFQVLTILVPTVNIIALVLGIVEVIPFSVLGFTFIIFVITNLGLQKSISQLQSSYEKKLKILSTYAVLMEIIETQTMESPALVRIKDQLTSEKSSASVTVKELAKLMSILDQRSNVLVSTVLNGLLFWELRQVIQIESWKSENAHKLRRWLQAVGEIDAISSLANFAYNHTDYTYPQITSYPFALHATEMGHPLMREEKCVTNGVSIPLKPFFVIITGANMAGKSTYLRTIGVNYLLACIGAPTCSKEFELYPSQLITSLRTSDSLNENESYFFAELKRLKLIIDKLNNGEELFIVLDEILKGTNSIDKQKGSFALIRQLMKLQANGIIATHDLLLGTLIELFPENIRNYCFEAEIKNNELTFAYRLKEGVAQNMNACFLMKKMGIIVDENHTVK